MTVPWVTGLMLLIGALGLIGLIALQATPQATVGDCTCCGDQTVCTKRGDLWVCWECEQDYFN